MTSSNVSHEDLVSVFHWLDANEESKIPRQRMLDGLHLLGFNPSKREMREICGQNTSFSFVDFAQAVSKQKKHNPADLLAAFNLIDDNGDGNLSREELISSLTNGGERMSKNEVSSALEAFDQDGDGNIDYNEFCDMIIRLMDNCKQPEPIKQKTPIKQRTPSPSTKPSTMTKKSQRNEHHDVKENRSSNRISQPKTSPVRQPTVQKQEDTIMIGTNHKEPSGLQRWECDRMHGTLQAETDGTVSSQIFSFVLTSSTETFISIRLKGSRARTIDLGCFLVKDKGGYDALPELVDFVLPQIGQQACLNIKLGAGNYRIIPFSSGCRLKKRRKQPSKKEQICVKSKKGWSITPKASAVIGEIFDRVDLDMKGTIGREEYDLLLLYTDGERCDDDSWQYVIQNFHSEGGELTRKGFEELWTSMLLRDIEESSAEDLYVNGQFEELGYNQALELDEAIHLVTFIFTKKDVLKSFEGLPVDDAIIKQMIMMATLQYGVEETSNSSVDMYTLTGPGGYPVLLVGKNESKKQVKARVDLSGSRNATLQHDATEAPVKIPPGGAVLLTCAMPTNPSCDLELKYTCAPLR